MTTDELKKEAEKYVKQNYCEMCVMADDCKCGCIDCFTVQAYFASAESREKRIAELEKENAELKAENEANENGAKKYAEFYFETNDQLTKAKYLISKCIKLLKLYKKTNDLETVEQLENFLKESEVEK